MESPPTLRKVGGTWTKTTTDRDVVCPGTRPCSRQGRECRCSHPALRAHECMPQLAKLTSVISYDLVLANHTNPSFTAQGAAATPPPATHPLTVPHAGCGTCTTSASKARQSQACEGWREPRKRQVTDGGRGSTTPNTTGRPAAGRPVPGVPPRRLVLFREEEAEASDDNKRKTPPATPLLNTSLYLPTL